MGNEQSFIAGGAADHEILAGVELSLKIFSYFFPIILMEIRILYIFPAVGHGAVDHFHTVPEKKIQLGCDGNGLSVSGLRFGSLGTPLAQQKEPADVGHDLSVPGIRIGTVYAAVCISVRANNSSYMCAMDFLVIRFAVLFFLSDAFSELLFCESIQRAAVVQVRCLC